MSKARKTTAKWNLKEDVDFPFDNIAAPEKKQVIENLELCYVIKNNHEAQKLIQFLIKNSGREINSFAMEKIAGDMLAVKLSTSNPEVQKALDKVIKLIAVSDLPPKKQKVRMAANVVAIKSDSENGDANSEDDFLSSLDFHLKVKDEYDAEVASSKPAITLVKQDASAESTSPQNTDYFFKVANHQDFYKVGNSFYEDYKLGIKSFAFYGLKKTKSIQDTILGIAAFINYYEKKNVLVVSNSLRRDFNKDELWTPVTNELSAGMAESLSVNLLQCGTIFILDYSELMRIKQKLNGAKFEDFLLDFVEMYSLVVWELPDLVEMSHNNEFYFPLCLSLESISLILNKGANKTKELEGVMAFFQKYGIKIKGFLLDKGS